MIPHSGQQGSATGTVDISRRIDDATIFKDFEMNMRSGRATAATHQADNLAFFDYISNTHQKGLMMPIAGRKAATMVDFDHLSIAAAGSGKHYNARCDCDDIGTFCTCEIHTIMPGSPAINGIVAHAEP